MKIEIQYAEVTYKPLWSARPVVGRYFTQFGSGWMLRWRKLRMSIAFEKLGANDSLYKLFFK